jgi:hypothetical protein
MARLEQMDAQKQADTLMSFENQLLGVDDKNKKNIDKIEYEPVMKTINARSDNPYYYMQYNDGTTMFGIDTSDVVGAKVPLIGPNGNVLTMSDIRARADALSKREGRTITVEEVLVAAGILTKGEDNEYRPAK